MSSTSAPPDWDAIRHRYVETDAAISAIIGDAGITHLELENARRRGDWRRKKPRGLPPGRRPSSAVIAASRRSRAAEEAGTQKRPRKRSAAANPPESATARAAAASTAADTAPVDAPFAIPPVPTDDRELLARFGTVIWLKLLQLEESMKTDLSKKKGAKRASSTDHEREVRAVNTLIDNVGKKKEMEAELARQHGTLADPDLAREAERYQREFTEHLEKILKSQEQEEA